MSRPLFRLDACISRETCGSSSDVTCSIEHIINGTIVSISLSTKKVAFTLWSWNVPARMRFFSHVSQEIREPPWRNTATCSSGLRVIDEVRFCTFFEQSTHHNIRKYRNVSCAYESRVVDARMDRSAVFLRLVPSMSIGWTNSLSVGFLNRPFVGCSDKWFSITIESSPLCKISRRLYSVGRREELEYGRRQFKPTRLQVSSYVICKKRNLYSFDYSWYHIVIWRCSGVIDCQWREW